MEKAFVYIAGMDIDDQDRAGSFTRFVYKVIEERDGVPTKVYSGNIRINAALSANENLDAMKLQVAMEAATRGYKLTLGDVIPSGAFITKDEISSADKSNGITSDKFSTGVIEIKTDTPVKEKLVARMTASVKRGWDAMFG